MSEHKFQQIDIRFTKEHFKKTQFREIDGPESAAKLIQSVYHGRDDIYAIIGVNSAHYPQYMTYYTREQLMEELVSPDRLITNALLHNTPQTLAVHVQSHDIMEIKQNGIDKYIRDNEENLFLKISGAFKTVGIEFMDIVNTPATGRYVDYNSLITSCPELRNRFDYPAQVVRRIVNAPSKTVGDIDIELYGVKTVRENINTPEDAIVYLGNALSNDTRESSWVIYLDRNYKPINYMNIGVGGINTAPVDLRIVSQAGILSGAKGMIFLHNHPSGITSSSEHDLATSIQIHRMGNILDMPLCDSIIIPAGFKDNKKFKSLNEAGESYFSEDYTPNYKRSEKFNISEGLYSVAER